MSLARFPVLVLMLTLAGGLASTAAEDIRLAGMRLGSAWYVFSATLYKQLDNVQMIVPGCTVDRGSLFPLPVAWVDRVDEFRILIDGGTHGVEITSSDQLL